MSKFELPDLVDRRHLLEERLAEAAAAEQRLLTSEPPFDKAFSDAPRVVGILATLAPQPPKVGASIKLLADFFCDIEAWFEVAQAYCDTLNGYLFADGLVSERTEPLAAFLEDIVKQTRQVIAHRVPGTGLDGRPVFGLQIDDVSGYTIKRADAPMHFSSSWVTAADGMCPHGYAPVGDHAYSYMRAVSSGEVTRKVLVDAHREWNDEAASAIHHELARASRAIAKGVAGRLTPLVRTTDDSDFAKPAQPEPSRVEVRVLRRARGAPASVRLIHLQGSRCVRTLTVKGTALPRLIVLVAEAQGVPMDWQEVLRRWMAQRPLWGGKLLNEKTLKDYGRRVNRRLKDEGFGEFWRYGSDSVAWAGAVAVHDDADTSIPD